MNKLSISMTTNASDILHVCAHREDEAQVDLGRGHLLLLAQVQQQLVLQEEEEEVHYS